MVIIGNSTGRAGENVIATAIIIRVMGRRDERSKFCPKKTRLATGKQVKKKRVHSTESEDGAACDAVVVNVFTQRKSAQTFALAARIL